MENLPYDGDWIGYCVIQLRGNLNDQRNASGHNDFE